MSDRSPRFEAGDGIRGLLAFVVFNLHAALAALVWSGHPELIPQGAADMTVVFGDVLGAPLSTGVTAVPVFFVLSAYLVGRPFMAALVAGRSAPALARYTVNRVLRVVPAYWTILIVVAVAATVHGAPLDGLARLAVFDVEVDEPLSVWIGQAWTLEVEMKFYLALPLLFLALSVLLRPLGRRTRVVLLTTAFAAGMVVGPLVDQTGPGILRSFAAQLPFFGAGLMLAVLEPSVRPRARGARWVRVAAGVATLAALAVLLAGPLLADAIGDLAISELIRAFAIAVVVAGPLVAEWVGGGTWRLFAYAPIRWLGTRSYSFYLMQLIVVNELGQALVAPGDGYKVALLWLYPLALVVTLIASDLLYRAVERPYLRRKRGRLRAPGEGTAMTPAQAAP